MDRRQRSITWLGWELYEAPADVLSGITEEENLAYAKSLFICVNGDGRITPPEREWILGYLAACGHSDDVLHLMETYDGQDDLEDLLNTSTLVRATGGPLLYDAIRACEADGPLHTDERAQLTRMAMHFGISEEKLAELEAVTQKERELRRHRHDLLVPAVLAQV